MKRITLNEFFRIKKLAGLINENFLHTEQIKEIVKGYFACAMWTEEENLNDDMNQHYHGDFNKVFNNADDDDDDNQVKTSHAFNEENIDSDSIIQAYNDIKTFIQSVRPEYIIEAIEDQGTERLGHDIWLTRNRHGSGFFDHSYSDEAEKALTKAAQDLKEIYVYIGDDGMLHFSNTR